MRSQPDTDVAARVGESVRRPGRGTHLALSPAVHAGTLSQPAATKGREHFVTRALLAIVVLTLTGLDHWTTYLCLREPVAGWAVAEANPFAEWLFSWAGLVPGLLIDTLITVAALVFLLSTSPFAGPLKTAFLCFIAAATGYAVANNLVAIADLGLSPFGTA
jgi:hypothetical protein